MLPKPAPCAGCPASATSHGFVPPSGPADARLAIVGQGPGYDEAALAEPFVGVSGRHLNKWLVKAGVPHEKCAVSNIVWCQLPGNRKPSPKEIAHCWNAHVGPHLRSLPELRVIVAVGLPAAQKFIPGAKASTVGTVARTEDPPAYVVPIMHPAAIVRGAWAYDPAQPRFLRRAWEIATSESPPNLLDVSEPPPGGTVAKTVHEVAAFLGEVLIDGAAVACDIEGTGGILIGIGFARMDNLASLYVPFRDFATPFWSEEDTHTAAYWVDRVLSEPKVEKIFHNGASFDVPFLEEIGFEVRGYGDDTMVRAWSLYHEMGKSLQELAILYAGLQAWKHTSHVGDEGEGK
jgi:uracil-DNA glycosylase family 4